MSNESPDLTTLDREALARMVTELQSERDDLQASLAWLVNVVIENHEIVATPNKEAWLSRAKECGKNWRRNLAEMQESAATWRERAELAEAERDKLLAAIAKHHSQKADDRCFLDDDELYAAAGLPVADRRVGDKLAMLENCKRFIERRCEGGGWPTYAELEAQLAAARAEVLRMSQEIARLEGEFVEIERELAEVKQHDQRLQILCGELCAVGAEGVNKASTAAIEIQDRIEGLEADNARLRAALAQVGEKVKTEIMTAAWSAANCNGAGITDLLSAISKVDLAAIVTASAADNASRQDEPQRRCGWCGNPLTPNEVLFKIYEGATHQSAVVGYGCYECYRKSKREAAAEGQEAGDGK